VNHKTAVTITLIKNLNILLLCHGMLLMG